MNACAAGRNDYVGMSAIDGLVTAVVAGPATVEPAVWLPSVFGGTMPQTKPGSLEERLVNTVLNRHDEVDHLLANAPGNYYPILMQDKGKTVVDAWAIEFALGLGLGGEAWAPILLATPKPIITPIWPSIRSSQKCCLASHRKRDEKSGQRLISIFEQQ
ncbi:YecA family protein [Rhizobium grahamii]|uniref:YecA/YgfB family protein n=1 Tax=Rhizobium grahamii TaxID=1120045 RepID=UPI001FD248F0|nr:YecA family protein [Rhizobium grahamii]